MGVVYQVPVSKFQAPYLPPTTKLDKISFEFRIAYIVDMMMMIARCVINLHFLMDGVWLCYAMFVVLE